MDQHTAYERRAGAATAYAHGSTLAHGGALTVAVKSQAGSGQSSAELDRLRDFYADYHVKSRWATESRGNRAIHEERAHALRRVSLRLPCPLEQARILDVGCGSGSLLGMFASWGARGDRLTGVDLMTDRIAVARQELPGIHFEVANAEQLPFDDSAFDVVCAFTVFSSLLDRAMATRVASEIGRVLAPGGVVVWYDLRVGNPANSHVRGLPAAEIQTLFPGYVPTLESLTLAPPLARSLGPATSLIYPFLAAVPFLRTHYLGTLRKPAP